MTKSEERVNQRLRIVASLRRLEDVVGEIRRRVMRDENPGTHRAAEIKKEAEFLERLTSKLVGA